jgi:outer membrane biosynthesis protein TonB
VPTLKLPASLRREALKTSLKVRVVIEADGSADFKLAESSGNADVDDFVLEQLRKVAVVTTALDDQGQPRRVMKPVQVKIEVD